MIFPYCSLSLFLVRECVPVWMVYCLPQFIQREEQDVGGPAGLASTAAAAEAGQFINGFTLFIDSRQR